MPLELLCITPWLRDLKTGKTDGPLFTSKDLPTDLHSLWEEESADSQMLLTQLRIATNLKFLKMLEMKLKRKRTEINHSLPLSSSQLNSQPDSLPGPTSSRTLDQLHLTLRLLLSLMKLQLESTLLEKVISGNTMALLTTSLSEDELKLLVSSQETKSWMLQEMKTTLTCSMLSFRESTKTILPIPLSLPLISSLLPWT